MCYFSECVMQLYFYNKTIDISRLVILEFCESTKRSSHRRCSVEKGVLKSFTKFTGKHLCQSLFFNKIAALRPATLLKKSPWHRCFPVKVVKFPRTSFLTEHIWWLLLNIHCACFSSIKKIVFNRENISRKI